MEKRPDHPLGSSGHLGACTHTTSTHRLPLRQYLQVLTTGKACRRIIPDMQEEILEFDSPIVYDVNLHFRIMLHSICTKH